MSNSDCKTGGIKQKYMTPEKCEESCTEDENCIAFGTYTDKYTGSSRTCGMYGQWSEAPYGWGKSSGEYKAIGDTASGNEKYSCYKKDNVVERNKKILKVEQTINNLNKNECGPVSEELETYYGDFSDVVKVFAMPGGICNSRMMRRLLSDGSGEQTFEVKAELNEDQVDEVEKLVTSSDFHDDITSAIQSVAPGATADPISPDSISIEEVQDEETCEDVQPPTWYKNNSCEKQRSAGKCPNRVLENSMYCRKTCGMCGEYKIPNCHDLEPPAFWINNSCAKQLATGKCAKRKQKNSKFCRKTCGTCS
jgi:hypothetical protein